MPSLPKKSMKLSTKLMIPLIVIAVLYMAVIGVVMRMSGIFTLLYEDALELLHERTANKQLTLQEDLSGHWQLMDALSDEVLTRIAQTLREHDATPADIAGDADLNADIVADVSPILCASLRIASSNGIFLILDGIGVAGQEGSYAGVYLRDSDPDTAAADNSDVMLLRGLPPISRMLGISLDSYWRASFTFKENNGSFFFQPLQAAQEGTSRVGTSRVGTDYGQWTAPFTLSNNDAMPIVTYSIPLIDDQGNVLGVLGTETSVSHLSLLLNRGELSRTEPGCYVLASSADGHSFSCAATAGTLFRQHFDVSQDTLTAESWVDESTMTLTGSRSGQKIYASVQLLNMNSSSAENQWYVLGLQTEDMVMSFTYRFQRLLVISCLVALLLAVIIALIASGGIVRPVTQLVHKLQQGGITQDRLDTTGVREIDILAQEIITQSNAATLQSQRLNRVLSMTDTLLGVYEIRDDDRTAFCSRGVYQAFGLVYNERQGTNISRSHFRHILDTMLTNEVDKGVFRVVVGDQVRYLRHRQLVQTDCTLGTLVDVTSEMEYRYRVEYERDYDVLTGLLNRRAFVSACCDLFEKPERLKHAAVMMMDLDNLKFINDTYGHDTGDNYIRCFASALHALDESACIYGRRSGDEFYALVYGWDSREELESFLQAKWQVITAQTLTLSDGNTYRIHASSGVSWYPEDNQDFNTLVHFADYAMYQVKHSNKGVLQAYDPTTYADYANMMSNHHALDELLNNRLVKYAFQPIVSAVTGMPLGYELLMRPQMPELSSPDVVLKMAKAQGMLHHVELITWTCALAAADSMERADILPKNSRLFINSIANQVLSAEEEEDLTHRYAHLFPRVVVEVTESEANCEAFTQHKQDFTRRYGGQIAIDDFGTGYSNEITLMNVSSNYVKLDIAFIRDVNTRTDKQAIVRALIAYAHGRNIAVICEGVETDGEMATLIDMGVDYLQGYLLGYPSETPLPVAEDIRARIRALQAKRRPSPPPASSRKTMERKP